MTAEQPIQDSDENVKQADAEQVQAGTLLKNQREALGLSQKQIADRLRLRISIIQNIENNDFSFEQVATFTRGYLRSYAKAVNLDEALILSALGDCQETQPQPQQMKSFSRQTKQEKHDSRIMTLTWGIFLVILGISSVWWWQNQDIEMTDLTTISEQEQQLEQQADQELNFTTLAEQEPQQSEQPQTTIDAEPSLLDADQQNDELLPQETEIINESVEPEPVIEPQPVEVVEPSVVAPVEQAVSVSNRLQMTFSDDCWIQVKDASGKTLSTGVKKGGQALSLEGEMPYSVILGAPENVSMILASEPVDLSGYTSGKVARFNLP
ncbi:cytoskeleton protein RodZ [Vibrio pacinii]|uniref:cytoskeleton protein RodZ n=1 Tax=Vibrio pacinii TaxID=170674 RepID=UPI00056F65B0|nr:cytoskeleton protein RodZ [Vibrio pacinii]